MSRSSRLAAIAVLWGLLLSSAACQRFPQRGTPAERYEVRVLTDAVSVKTRLGRHLAGYLAESETDFLKGTDNHYYRFPRRIFISLDILKYEKGERLKVMGRPAKDDVRVSYGAQAEENFPVVFVLEASPTSIDLDIEKKLPAIKVFK